VALAAGRTAGTGTAKPEPGGVPPAVDVTVNVMGVASVGGPSQPEPAQPVPPYRSAHILWAALSKRSGRPSLESCDAQNQGHIVHM